jgi:hypothetical protein
MLRIILAACCLGAASSAAGPAEAQVNDSLVSTSFEYYPSASNGEQPGETQLNVFRAAAGVPISVAERTKLVLATGYELLDVHPSAAAGFQLHAPKLTLGVIQELPKGWGVMGFVDAGLASDFGDDLGSSDVLFSVTAIGTYAIGDALTLGAGAVYDRRTGSLSPLPAALLKWRISERLRVRGFAPAFVNAEYHATPWLDLGLRSTFEGNRFHLGDERWGASSDLELAYSSLTLGPKATMSWGDWLHLDVYAAAALYRRYELFQDDVSVDRYRLSRTVGYGARFWVAPSGW